jgi:hypothetical protein
MVRENQETRVGVRREMGVEIRVISGITRLIVLVIIGFVFSVIVVRRNL